MLSLSAAGSADPAELFPRVLARGIDIAILAVIDAAGTRDGFWLRRAQRSRMFRTWRD